MPLLATAAPRCDRRPRHRSEILLQAVVRQIGAKSGYTIESHRLELYGLCPECQAENGA